MKSTRCTYHVALAVVLLMLLTLFPHHHHDGGAACWTSEICHDDGRANDVHTRHHAGDNQHLCYWHSVQNVPQRTLSVPFGGGPLPCFLPTEFWQQRHTIITTSGEALCGKSPVFFGGGPLPCFLPTEFWQQRHTIITTSGEALCGKSPVFTTVSRIGKHVTLRGPPACC